MMKKRRHVFFPRIFAAALAFLTVSGSTAGLDSILKPGSLTVSAVNENPGSAAEDFEYVKMENGTISITRYKGNDSHAVIPGTIDGKKVTSIGSSAFSGCTGLAGVTIPDSVSEICNHAFFGCTNLSDIHIPDSVTSIGEDAFKLTVWYNNQPDGDVYAGKVYYQYKGTMPENTRITIKNGTTMITSFAFYNCKGLSGITIPDSVTKIGMKVFDKTAWLENHPDGEIYIGKVFYRYKGTMPENTKITIKNGTTMIANGAFSDCKGLSGITIPDSVTDIESSAFSGCTGLTGITMPDSVTKIDGNVFSGCTGLTRINIPKGVTSIGVGAFKGCMNLSNISVPDGVTIIETSAFYECTGLTSIIIPGSVTSIEDAAFYGCTGLTNVSLPKSISMIGMVAFQGCTGLTGMTIPDGVTSIGKASFYGCTGLTSIFIPDSVTSIEYDAFDNCNSLTIYCKKNSYAEQYASKQNIPYMIITTNETSLSAVSNPLGKTVTINCHAEGGSPPFSYAVYYKKSTDNSFTQLQALSTNETVSFTPTAIGKYIIRTKVKDAAGSWDVKDLNLEVYGKPENTSAVSSAKIGLGSTVTITASAAGGKTPYSYAVYAKKSTDSSFTQIQALGTNNKITYKPTAAGTYTIRTKVKDNADTWSVKDLTVEVVNPLSNTSKVSAAKINLNSSVTITASATGGTSPYSYAVYAKKSTSSSFTQLQALGTNNKITYKPTAAGTYTIRTKVKDAAGTWSVKDLTVEVINPLSNTSKVSAAKINLGSSVTITASATGGTSPYSYAVYAKKSTDSSYTQIQALGTNNKMTYKPTAKGTYTIRTKVKDAAGTWSVKELTVTVS